MRAGAKTRLAKCFLCGCQRLSDAPRGTQALSGWGAPWCLPPHCPVPCAGSKTWLVGSVPTCPEPLGWVGTELGALAAAGTAHGPQTVPLAVTNHLYTLHPDTQPSKKLIPWTEKK